MDWTVSLCNNAPYCLHISATCFSGRITPISLFTCMRLTSILWPSCFLSKSSKCAKSTAPVWSMATNSKVILNSSASASAVCNTAWCSMGLVMSTCVPKSRTAPLSTKLSASVPPEVKIISPGWALNCLAISFLHCSRMALEDWPILCVEEGLPYSFCNTSLIIATTSGLTAVVAALSKYTFGMSLYLISKNKIFSQ